jgi:hypothetical protein
MPDVDEFDFAVEDEDEATEEGSQDTSKGLKALRAAHRKAQKENDELKKQLSEFRESQRKNTVADALDAKGLSKKLAKFVIADAGDSEINTEYIDTWLSENGELFGIEPDAQQVDEETQDAARRVSQASSKAKPQGTSIEELYQRLGELDPKDPEFRTKQRAIYDGLSSIQ